jgi:hypothetical protein
MAPRHPSARYKRCSHDDELDSVFVLTEGAPYTVSLSGWFIAPRLCWHSPLSDMAFRELAVLSRPGRLGQSANNAEIRFITKFQKALNASRKKFIRVNRLLISLHTHQKGSHCMTQWFLT